MKSLFKKAWNKFKLIWLFLSLERDSWRKLGKCDVLLMSADADKGDTVGGLAYSKLIDSIDEFLTTKGFICQQIALPIARIHGTKSWSGAYSFNKRWILTDFFGLRFVKLLSSIRWPKIFRCIGNYLTREQIFLDMFAICRPIKVVVIGATADLCVAGKKAGVEIVELLHGIGYPSPPPWGWGTKDWLELPEKILCLDEVSSKTFGILLEKGVKVFEIEHPFYRRFAHPGEYLKSQKEWANDISWIPKYKKIILVGLTWGYSGENGNNSAFYGILNNGIMPDSLIQAIRETRDSVYWLLRLHPVQLREPFRYKPQITVLKNLVNECGNCEFEKSSELALHKLLNCSDGHVTMISMTTYEAAYRGLKTLLLCPTLSEGGKNSRYFRDLIASGYAQLGEMDVKKISNWIFSLPKDKTPLLIDNTKKINLLDALELTKVNPRSSSLPNREAK